MNLNVYRLKSNAILCLLCLLWINPLLQSASAQNGKLFGADDHLSSSFVNQVYLDNDGFIWVVTRNGLCKYDGYKFHNYKKDNAQGMASNYVNCVLQAQSGLFYVGMYGALQTYNGSEFKDVAVKDLNQREVPCYVTCFLQTHDGRLLVGTSGHGLLEVDNPRSAHQLNGGLAKVNTVNHLLEDHAGRIWIVTDNMGLLVYENGKVTRRYLTDERFRARISHLCEDRQNRIYAATTGLGVYRLENGAFQQLQAVGNAQVSDLYLDRSGHVLIGFDGNGIGILNTTNDQLSMNPYVSRDVDLSTAKVMSITQDKGGNLWLGMLQKGVYMHPHSSPGFKYMGYKLGAQNLIGNACVTSTFIDSKGRFYIGTDKDGLYQFAPDRRLMHHYLAPLPSTVLTIDEDEAGRIWVGSFKEGCGWIDPNARQYHPQVLPQGASVSVFDLEDDRQGHVWFATMGNGLLCLNSADGTVKAYNMKQGADNDRKVNCIINDYITKMSVSPDRKRIYTATTMGVSCLDLKTGSWLSTFGENCLLYGQAARVVREFDGILWIGTNDGLYSYDLKTKKMKNYLDKEGLGENGIASIEKDDTGRLWISTDHGLCCLEPKKGRIDTYFVDNGLQSNEFSDGASCVGPDGSMLFGGVGGITWFYPDDIHPRMWQATVKLTAMLLNGEPVGSETKSGHYQVCDTTVMASRKFHLSHRDNSFTLQLSTLTYDNPEHISYSYSINDEPEVRMLPGQNEISFSHLSPGTYRFKVRATHNNLSTPVLEFTVVVHHPWWQTWWAYLIYLAILGVILRQYLLYRKRQERDRLRLQEHIHAEQLGEAKLSTFMNISHEIRTPMTLILTPLHSLIKKDKDPERKSVYETMRRNAERILGLINQMMDLRKIDKGMMQMRMQKTDLIGFLDDIHSLFEHQAKAKQIKLLFQHEDSALPVWIDRTNFDKVVVNLLSNAFKFTPTGGVILIEASHDEKNATVRIADNGEPIPADKLERIFERFYQAPTDVNDRNVGTGIGLDLTRSLVELHHGTVSASNVQMAYPEGAKPSQWVEFKVVIPLGHEHLTPDEIMEETATAEVPAPVEEFDDQELVTELDNNRPYIIVVAEDDDEIRNYLVHELSNDYTVYGCANGKEALAQTLKVKPDLVLSDIMMPEMDGNALASTLKQNPQTSHIPIVLLTAKNRDEDHLEGLETGADAYIVKPFNMDILRRTIVNLMQSRRQLLLKYARNDKLEDKVETVAVKSPDEKLLERIMVVINQNIANSSLSVDFLADAVGISRVHLHRKMKELTGQTPHDFVRNIRLKQAANLLAEGNMNVAEVVYACGFGNAASFSTVFKKFYGMSPREYMQEHAKRS